MNIEIVRATLPDAVRDACTDVLAEALADEEARIIRFWVVVETTTETHIAQGECLGDAPE